MQKMSVQKRTSLTIQKMILDSIELSGYLPDTDSFTVKEKVDAVHTIFKSEYIHDNNKQIAEVILFSEWLSGLPSALTVPFYYDDILEIGYSTGVIKDSDTEYRREDFLQTWFLRVAKDFFKLKKYLINSTQWKELLEYMETDKIGKE